MFHTWNFWHINVGDRAALKSKNPTAQVNELLAKIIAYNLTVVIHEMYENGIQSEFLHVSSAKENSA